MRSDGIRLNNGMTIPVIGFGTYSYENDRKTTEHAVRTALKMGYRHFDTAHIYGSEVALGNALGEAIYDGIVERQDLFVTSKLWGSHHHDPVAALNQTLMKLGMEYVDMYLVHWPVKLKPWVSDPLPRDDEFEPLDLESTWLGMEKCLEMGLCRGIGVSNFSCKKLQTLMDFASVPPAVNQVDLIHLIIDRNAIPTNKQVLFAHVAKVEMHPMWRQKKLRELCKDHKIHVSAYSPLGGPGNLWGSTAVVESPVMKSIAEKRKATAAQVALRWGVWKGSSVIVKSFNQERMKENMAALNLNLQEQDILQIDANIKETKIMRGECYVNQTSSPYKTIQHLWDDEI